MRSTERQVVGCVYVDVCISISVSVIISCAYLLYRNVRGCVMVILYFLRRALYNFVKNIK